MDTVTRSRGFPTMCDDTGADPIRKGLPEELRHLFWDCKFEDLEWSAEHRDFMITRILSSADLKAIRWLLTKISKEELYRWFIQNDGSGLDPRTLRFWELALEIPSKLVDEWIKDAKRSIWERRFHR